MGERGPNGLELLRPGYTEWYAIGIERLQENPRHGVRLIRPPEPSPYR
jgi:hypothetical protein